MDEQRIREIVREELKKAAEEGAAVEQSVTITIDGERFASVISPILKPNRDKPPEAPK